MTCCPPPPRPRPRAPPARRRVITRDNAMICIDAVLTYRIINPKTMIYSTQNLPEMLSKIMQVGCASSRTRGLV